MKYIATADWHLTGRKPRIRTDPYPETQLKKVEYICKVANEKVYCPIIIAGDIFDKPSYPISLLNKLISILKSVENGVYVVYGQHDLFYHNPDLAKTPLGTLFASEAVFPIKDLVVVPRWKGFNFGEEITPIENKQVFMTAHFPVTQYDPPFYMPDALSAKDFMDKHPSWKVIITGDYHTHHITKTKNRMLINPGPICRSSKDKMNFKPSFTIFDPNILETEVIPIPIEEKVFDLDLADKDDVVSYREDIRELAKSIKSKTVGKKFKDVLDEVVLAMKTKKSVRVRISQVMEKVYERTKAA